MVLISVIIVFFLYLILHHIFTAPTLIEGNTTEPNSEVSNTSDSNTSDSNTSDSNTSDPNSEVSEQENKDSAIVHNENCVDQHELDGLKEKYKHLENNYNKFKNKFDYTTEELELLLDQCLK